MIRTRLSFLVAPGMAAGTMVGILINITFPAIFIVLLIEFTSFAQIRKVYAKALQLY